MKEVFRPEIAPNEAVAEAMMMVIARQIKPYWENLFAYLEKGFGREQSAIDYTVYMATKEHCRLASANVIFLLNERYGDVFQRLLLVESISNRENMMRNGWGWHDYFLALGKDGNWYAGSPANFQNGMENTGKVVDMCLLLINKDIEKLLEEIESIEGGEWPNGKEILRICDEQPNLLRVGDEPINRTFQIFWNQLGKTMVRESLAGVI